MTRAGKDDAPALFEFLKSQGLPLFGGLAQNSLRMEKGYMVRADFDYSHYKECDIDMFVTKKRAFVGKDDDYAPTQTAALIRYAHEKER